MLTFIGLSLGFIAAGWLTRVLKGMLIGAAPTDTVTFVGITFVLGTAAVIASWMPARRAAKVDPMVALRYE